MTAIWRSTLRLQQAANKNVVSKVQSRNLNLMEYQSKNLLDKHNVCVQKFMMVENKDEAKTVAKDFSNIFYETGKFKLGCKTIFCRRCQGICDQGADFSRRPRPRAFQQWIQGRRSHH
jgi:hypothetical protein